MHRLILAASLFLSLSACGPTPVGTWAGTMDFYADDGNIYTNNMEVVDDGSADITLYVLVKKDEQLMIGVSWFTADWEQDADEVTFDLVCDWDGCAWESTMDCTLDEDALFCDMTPDFYMDDEAMLEWVRDEE
ncbi:MAG: hypothetical protein ABIO70_25905 [Pseudomonadota bacterium]